MDLMAPLEVELKVIKMSFKRFFAITVYLYLYYNHISYMVACSDVKLRQSTHNHHFSVDHLAMRFIVFFV